MVSIYEPDPIVFHRCRGANLSFECAFLRDVLDQPFSHTNRQQALLRCLPKYGRLGLWTLLADSDFRFPAALPFRGEAIRQIEG